MWSFREACLPLIHVFLIDMTSLESRPHIPEPLSVVKTEGDGERAKKK